MADRSIVYTGALPQSTDILNSNKFSMLGLGYAMHGVLGTSTAVEGLACTPTSPTPDLNVHVAVGSIYSVQPTDASAYGDLGIDNASIVKQGILNTALTLAVTPPGTVGFSQVYLVQAIYNDVDAGSLVLSYFNASNPAAPYSGPANSGTSQFTKRTGVCVVALKAGVAATTGTQSTPAPDAGYTGLFAVTVVNGQTQITSPNIVQLTTAPFFPTLPAVPPDVQTSFWTYAVDSSTGGVPFNTNGTTTGGASATLNFASVPAWVTVGMKAFDLTTVGAITGGQTVLSKTATTVVLSANVNATAGSGDTIAFSFNAIVASIVPAPTALVPGLCCRVKLSSTNTAATTLNLNGLGAVAVRRAQGTALAAGDIAANMIVELIYDGTAFQTLNFEGSSGSGTTSFSTIGIPYCVDTGTVNAIVAPFAPAITSLSAGTTIEVKIANTNSGATTIAVNAIAAVPVVDKTQTALVQGALVAGEVALMIYDGTSFQVVNNTIPQIFSATTFFVNNSTGNDNNNGLSSGTAWATVAHALVALKTYNLNGNTITIQLATTGINYPMPTTFTAPSSGSLIVQGQVGTQSAVIAVQTPTGGVFNINGSGGNITLQWMTIWQTGAVGGCIFANGSLTLTIQNNTFLTTGFSAYPILQTGAGVLCLLGAGNQWGGSAAALFWVGGTMAMTANQALINGPTFSTATAVVQLGGQFFLSGGAWVFTGSGALGPRYAVSYNGIVLSNGNGANFFPGNTPGSAVLGGIYT